ncbi:16S rRNA (uracil(1498)-N(3))-methyltransferase [Paludibacterium paludis]|uniref:Ribosomal RNA small subunit methyltransferase E n=1 Tax=Paludibacterium paludis TaxID=1225769 RepID=A0A918P143_9NEIS|nr:16S rRNA (uracil(1498)-N(3))-methyltransferase [Paludibacterium paludis]GGY12570.1 ribosomal RNA small subunit methyltransferase E [Paludibacterium paludis]
MPRFYLEGAIGVGETLSLPDDVVRHMHVLRLREGDEVVLFNGQSGEYAAKLVLLEKREALAQVGAFHPVSRESPLWLGLAQGISSGDRMEFTLQKGVEMGVNVFQPLAMERSVVKLAAERADKRVARWRDIVRSACEQCGRNLLPEVRPIMGMREWLEHSRGIGSRLVLSPYGDRTLSQQAKPEDGRLWLMAGPEGGFAPSEEQAAFDAGWQPLKLGPRVLRTETAALAAVAALQTVWGDYTT